MKTQASGACEVCGGEPWMAASSLLAEQVRAARHPGGGAPPRVKAPALNAAVLEALHRAWQRVFQEEAQSPEPAADVTWRERLAILRWEEEGGRVP